MATLPHSVSLAVFRAHIENGLTVAIGVGLTGVTIGAALGFPAAVAAATGAVCVSISDRADPLRQKTWVMGFAFLGACLFTALSSFSHFSTIAFVIAVAFTGTALIMRVTRNNVLEELGKNYVMTLRAKGLPERVIIWKHVFRNAMHPLVSIFGQVLAFLINGFAITSIVLNLPTIQTTYLQATLRQDLFLASTILVMIAATVVIGNLISDLLLAWLDPRIRYD